MSRIDGTVPRPAAATRSSDTTAPSDLARSDPQPDATQGPEGSDSWGEAALLDMVAGFCRGLRLGGNSNPRDRRGAIASACFREHRDSRTIGTLSAAIQPNRSDALPRQAGAASLRRSRVGVGRCVAAWDVRSHLSLLSGALCKLTPRAHAGARRRRPLRIRDRSGTGKGAFVRSGERSECRGRRPRPKEPGRPSRLDDCTGWYHAHQIFSQTVPSGHNRRARPRMRSSIATDRRFAGATDPIGFSPGIIRETNQASAPCWPRRASGRAAQPRS